MLFPVLHVIARPLKATEAISKNILIASLFLSFLILAITPFFLPTTALAQATQPITPNSQPPTNYNTPNFNPEVPRNQHTFVQSAMIEVISSVFCIITGIDPITPQQGCLDIDPKTHKLGLRPPQDDKPQLGGLIGFLPGMFSVVYTPPASGTDYVRYLAGNFGITQPVYAQTSNNGFEALRPLLPIWTAARNVTYLLFVFVFIIIGLAIMLRVKIDPRTVMTLQNQIPRIIVGILLVTFSYAIAGLMIDGMWLLTYAGINTITQASADSNPIATNCATNDSTLQQRATKNLISTPFTYANEVLKEGCAGLDAGGISNVAWGVAYAIRDIVKDIVTSSFINENPALPNNTGITGIVNCLKWAWLPPIHAACVSDTISNTQGSSISASSITGLILGYVAGFIAGALALIIIFLAVMWAMLTLWFELLKAYVMLILYIIGAPLWIVTGLLPGTPLGFGKWMRRMFVHLAVFPAVAALLLVAAVLMNIFNNAGSGSFVPPMVGQHNMSGFGSLLAFAVILMAPTLLEVLKENLHATSKGGQIAAGGVVRGISGGAAAPKGLGSAVWGRFTQRGYMGQASDLTNLIAGQKDTKWSRGVRWLLGDEKKPPKTTA